MAEHKRKTEIPDDLRALRKRREAMRKRRVHAMRRRIFIVLAVTALVIAVFAVRGAKRRSAVKESAPVATSEEMDLGVSGAEVLHLSFPQLVIPDFASTYDDGAMTTVVFRQILGELYEDGYVLVDLHALVEKDSSERYHSRRISLPAGKKPLVLSERADRYNSEERGYASGLVLDASGKLANEVKDQNGIVQTGAYDVMTIVDEFVGKHPDFSYEGARGILAVTGGETVLGFTQDEKSGADQVFAALRDGGWNLASYTYGATSYGSEIGMFREDAQAWQDEVAELIGRADTILLPKSADIGGRGPYTEDNEKFSLLSGQGFRFFCVNDSENLSWMQTGDNYVRQGMHEVDSLRAFRAVIDKDMDTLRQLDLRARGARDLAADEAASGEETEANEDSSEDGASDGTEDDAVESTEETEGEI